MDVSACHLLFTQATRGHAVLSSCLLMFSFVFCLSFRASHSSDRLFASLSALLPLDHHHSRCPKAFACAPPRPAWVLVAKQINTSKEQGLFAARPPLEALPIMLSVTATGNKLLMFKDTSQTYMHARTPSDVFVELCEEGKTEPGDEHQCWKLVKSMYGTRTAAHDWQSEVTRTMRDLEFKGRQSTSMRVLASAKRHQSADKRGTISHHLVKGQNSSGCGGACRRGSRRRWPFWEKKTTWPRKRECWTESWGGTRARGSHARLIPRTRKYSVVKQEQRNSRPSQHPPRRTRDTRQRGADWAALRLGRGAEEQGDRRQVDVSTEGSTCLSSGARRRPWWHWVQRRQNWLQQRRQVKRCSGWCRCGRTLVRPQRTFDGKHKCSNRNHPVHWCGKGKTPEHELVVGPKERSITRIAVPQSQRQRQRRWLVHHDAWPWQDPATQWRSHGMWAHVWERSKCIHYQHPSCKSEHGEVGTGSEEHACSRQVEEWTCRHEWVCTAQLTRLHTKEDRPGEKLHTEWLPTREVETSSTSKTRRTSTVTRNTHWVKEDRVIWWLCCCCSKALVVEMITSARMTIEEKRGWNLMQRGNRQQPGAGYKYWRWNSTVAWPRSGRRFLRMTWRRSCARHCLRRQCTQRQRDCVGGWRVQGEAAGTKRVWGEEDWGNSKMTWIGRREPAGRGSFFYLHACHNSFLIRVLLRKVWN